MVGHLGGVVTLLEAKTTTQVTRVWCGLHQLDLKMQIVFEQAMQEKYLSKLHALISYLRRQVNLITVMRSKCPKVATTRWLSMYGVAEWLCVNGIAVRRHLEQTKAACDPHLMWWVFLFALRDVAKEANKVFISLQGLSTLVHQQQDRFVGLVGTLCALSGTQGPLSTAELEHVDRQDHEVCGAFVISHKAAFVFIEGLDAWVCENLIFLSPEETHTLVVAVARLCVVACSNIHKLTTKGTPFVPVTPKDLVDTQMPVLVRLTNHYRAQIERHSGEDGFYSITTEFKAMKEQYLVEPSFRDAIEQLDHRLATFDAMWKAWGCGTKYPTLAQFCGELASVFPNTATVESYFSLVGTAETEKKTSLTDLSLEGIIHCKQWERLKVAGAKQ